MIKFDKIVSLVLCMAMILSLISVTFAAEGDVFIKVTNVNELSVGDRVIIVADDADFALSTHQKSNNRGVSAITRSGNQVIAAADTQVLTLQAGSVEGTFAFYTGEGYLYAASSTGNQLKTDTTRSDNAAWQITIANGSTTIVAQGSNTRATMQYNPNDGAPLFTCYDAVKMSALSIYKLPQSAEAGEDGEAGEGGNIPEPADPVAVTIPEACELAQANNNIRYLVRGTVTGVTDTTYGNMYIEDGQGNSLYISGVYSIDGSKRYDAMDPRPSAGDEVLLLGVLTTYNSNPQMVNGWVQELVIGKRPEDQTPAEPVEITIPEASAIGTAQKHNVYTTEKYIVTGVVAEITGTTYGNLYIEDAEGNRLHIDGVYSADGSDRFDVMNRQPAVGDTVTILGVLGQFNGNPQMKNGWVIDIKISEQGGENPDNPDTPNNSDRPTNPDPPADPIEKKITIEAAIAIGSAKKHNTFTQDKYIVTGVITEITSVIWGNMYIEDANGNRLFIYGLYAEDGSVRFDAMDNKPAVGDTITVIGVLGQYDGNPQMKNGWLLGCEIGDSAQTGDPIMVFVCAMLLSGTAAAIAAKNFHNGLEINYETIVRTQ